ncbi:DUF6173 family protein [Litoreibacter roseus]|uniref:Uncharacterized protein n=1 Tax=Litoreibacter roseus TaxID=2601869 RepID=A0A6N6JG97_9RHOB|nr:DUF6173 family protein [Litoreibacter roseus]GFE64840.1 hypothetical protein KIN_19140 [Litoreibacter roseus]
MSEIKTTAEAIENAALPKSRAVHLSNCAPTPEQQPLPKGVTDKPLSEKSPAEWAYERLILYIKNFEEQLDNNHEIAMGFTGGTTGIMRIEGMGFYAPDIISFYGSDPEGGRTQQIQHVTQLNVLLRALPKKVDQPEPNRIGFRLAQDLEQD